jgi:hypothetical protein
MKLTDLTIEQFQAIAAIELSTAFEAHEKRVAVIAAYRRLEVDEIMKWPISKIVADYRTLIEQWNWLPELEPKIKFKAGAKWFVGAQYLNEMTAGQLIELMSYNVKDETLMVDSLHLIMASLCRECKYLRWAPEQYNGANHAKRAEHLRKHATIGNVWGLISFFLLISSELSKTTVEYSKVKMKSKPIQNGKHT